MSITSKLLYQSINSSPIPFKFSGLILKPSPNLLASVAVNVSSVVIIGLFKTTHNTFLWIKQYLKQYFDYQTNY